MGKQEFLVQLKKRLASLPRQEREERLLFYSEMIDDRMEEGLSEEDAVAAVAAQDLCGDKPQKEKKRLQWWELTLLILGSPIWFSLLVAAAAVVWSLVVSLWAVFAALAGIGFGVLVLGIVYLVSHPVTGLALMGASLVCAGLAVFAFFGCKAFTKGAARLTALPFRKKEVSL